MKSVADRLKLLEEQVDFLQLACGAACGLCMAMAVITLQLAPQKLLHCHDGSRPRSNVVEPELPMRKPVLDDGAKYPTQARASYGRPSARVTTNALVVPVAPFPALPSEHEDSP
jgi:hypothetical protein